MTQTARMYGGSLYDLAAEEGLDERILGELDETVSLLAANPDYLRLLATPSIPKKERCALLDEALQGAVHPYLLNFLKLLCEQGAVRELTGCARAYHLRFNQAHGVLEATAVSAVALSEAQADQLKQKLETATARSEELLGEARAQAAAMKQKAEADIAQQRKKAVNEVKDEIGGIAMEIASKVVEREIQQADHQELIDSFIQNVGEAS